MEKVEIGKRDFFRDIFPWVIMCLIILTLSVEHFIKIPALTKTSADLRTMSVVISNCLVFLGAINLSQHHIKKVRKGGKRWYFSAYIVLGMWILFILATMGLYIPSLSKSYAFIYKTFYIDASRAAKAVSAFFFVSMIFRGGRVRSWESGVFSISAILVVMKNTPIGCMISPYITPFADWLLTVPGMAGLRGLIIAAGIGIIGAGYRRIKSGRVA